MIKQNYTLTSRIRTLLWALLAATGSLVWADDTPVPGKAKLEITRSSGMMALMAARLEVNGHRLGELAKGESVSEVVEPGRVTVKVDNSYAPGQHIFSFTGEAYGVYRITIGDSLEKATIEQTFGWPPKVSDPMLVENGGSLRAMLSSAKVTPPPKPPEPAKPAEPPAPPPPAAVATPVTTASVAPQEQVQTKPQEDSGAKVEEQLRSLKRLFDQGLINADLYAEKQRKILDAMK
jgi:hypothetical protein